MNLKYKNIQDMYIKHKDYDNYGTLLSSLYEYSKDDVVSLHNYAITRGNYNFAKMVKVVYKKLHQFENNINGSNDMEELYNYLENITCLGEKYIRYKEYNVNIRYELKVLAEKYNPYLLEIFKRYDRNILEIIFKEEREAFIDGESTNYFNTLSKERIKFLTENSNELEYALLSDIFEDKYLLKIFTKSLLNHISNLDYNDNNNLILKK